MAFSLRHCGKVTEELIRGRESAIELKYLLRGPSTAPETRDQQVALVEKMFNSFEKSIEALALQNLKTINSVSECGDDDGGRISLTEVETAGCKMRNKCSESWVEETSAVVDDGRKWRKYGEKKILDAEFPRSYYRCTYKYDRKCEARKIVQQIQDNPPKYINTYYDHHSCSNFPGAYDDITSPNSDSAVLLNFSAYDNDNENNNEKEKEKEKEEEDIMLSNLNYYSTTSEVSPQEITSSGVVVGDNVFSGVDDFPNFDDEVYSGILYSTNFDCDLLQEFEFGSSFMD